MYFHLLGIVWLQYFAQLLVSRFCRLAITIYLLFKAGSQVAEHV